MNDTLTLNDYEGQDFSIKMPVQTFLILAQAPDSTEVVRVEVNGDVYHFGKKCKSDADYRAAFQSIINLMRTNNAT